MSSYSEFKFYDGCECDSYILDDIMYLVMGEGRERKSDDYPAAR